MTYTAVERLATDFDALVVGNNARNFSSGANIAGVLKLLDQGAWDELSKVILSIGQSALKLREATKPVVTAPHHISVGAGTVLAMTGWRSVAALEINLGFAEVNLGVIAAAGGCKETLRVKVNPAVRAGTTDVVSVVRKAFQQLATSKLSNTAWEAKALGYLRETDTVLVNSNDLLGEAKRQALELVASGANPPDNEQIYVAGPEVLAVLVDDTQRQVRAGQISAYDARVIEKTALVICGGDSHAPAWVDPNRLLELECEAFMSLLGEQKTMERLTTFVRTGRLLNN
jgi:3-hydroxyacyl-CoA dehydrogenase